jgi:hypothetical protein
MLDRLEMRRRGRRISVDVDEQEENKGERNQGMKESTNR